MPASKAHLYLASFMRLGLVVQDPVTARYGLGPYAIQLGVAGINQLDLIDVAAAPMDALQNETGVSVSLSIWGNRGPTIIQKLDGPWPIPVTIRVGFVLPLLTSATGRIFISFLPDREWHPIADDEAALRGGPARPAPGLVDAVRASGLATSDSEVNQGFAALSAPVFDHDGKLVAALTVLGLRSMIDTDADGTLANALRRAAATLSRAMGAPEPDQSSGDRHDR